MTHSTAVEVDTDVVEKLIKHIRQGSTDMHDAELQVPREHFISPDRAKQEVALFETLPLAAGHVSEIPEPGDFITRDVLGSSVIITRGKSGNIRAFHNVCAHRGGRVEQKESGHKKIFMCQYHGWSYNAEDGKLRKLSYEDSFGEIDYNCTGLHSIRVDVRYGLIFLTFDEKENYSLDDYFGPEVDAQLAPWDLENASIFIDESFEIAVNWKLVVDGALDSLHAQYLHPGPGNVGALTLTNVAVFKKFGLHGRLFAPRTRLKKLIDAGEEIKSSTSHVASIMLLFPNSLIAAAPDHIEYWTVWPSEDPSKCKIRIRFFVRPDIMDENMESRVRKSWEILKNAATNEDWPMEIWIQENANRWPDGVFRYGRNEVSARHLHNMLAEFV